MVRLAIEACLQSVLLALCLLAIGLQYRGVLCQDSGSSGTATAKSNGSPPTEGRRLAEGQLVSSTSACFSGDSIVLHPNGSKGFMRDLKIGDQVAVPGRGGRLTYDSIYAFGHQDPDVAVEFVMIQTSSTALDSDNLELTADHFIPVAPAGNGTSARLKRAKDIQVGEFVWALAENASSLAPVPVVAISRVVKFGIYNPFTLSGSIVVSGVLASAHSGWFLDGLFDASGLTAYLPAAYQAILLPARLLYTLIQEPAYATTYAVLDGILSQAGGISEFGTRFGGILASFGSILAVLAAVQAAAMACKGSLASGRCACES